MKLLRSLFIFSFCLLLPTVALSLDFGESVQVHGFASQGYLLSSNNNFLAQSRGGSYEFTDFGLNANWAMFDRLRIGAQVFYRNLGDFSEDKVVLDWALLDYQPHHFVGVRLGKVKMPMGLYNENRDNDFLQSTIFLPQSIYDESRRDNNLAYLGGGLYGNLPTGSWGDLDYHFFTGESTFPDDSILAQSTERSLLENIDKNNQKPAAQQNPLLPASLESHERENEELYGGALVFNSSVTDLRLGFSLLRAKNYIYVNGMTTPLTESIIKNKFVVSLEYAWQDWLFVTEYGESDRKTVSAGVVTMDGPSQSYYGMISYSPFENWTFTALYDEFYRLKHDKDGSSKPNSPSYMGWRKDFGLAARYDFTDSWSLKTEYHYIDGGAMQLGVTNPDAQYPDRYWNFFAAKLSYNF